VTSVYLKGEKKTQKVSVVSHMPNWGGENLKDCLKKECQIFYLGGLFVWLVVSGEVDQVD